MSFVKNTLFALSFIFMIGYPFIIYYGLTTFNAKYVAVMMLVFIVLRQIILMQQIKISFHQWVIFVVMSLIFSVVYFINDYFLLFLIPPIINLILFIAFALTLFKSPSMIEVFALMQVDTLSPEEIQYCKNSTIAWCYFFILNGGIALFLSLSNNLVLWTFYTGFLAYILLSLLFVVELSYRYWRFRRYEGALTDRFFKPIFPPK